MIEASENIDLVTFNRQQDLEASQRETQIRHSQTVSYQQPSSSSPESSATTDTTPPPAILAVDPTGPAPATEGSTDSSGGGLTRIAITAILVAILFVVWVLQKKGSHSS